MPVLFRFWSRGRPYPKSAPVRDFPTIMPVLFVC
jgi:hypothetical protein